MSIDKQIVDFKATLEAMIKSPDKESVCIYGQKAVEQLSTLEDSISDKIILDNEESQKIIESLKEENTNLQTENSGLKNKITSLNDELEKQDLELNELEEKLNDIDDNLYLQNIFDLMSHLGTEISKISSELSVVSKTNSEIKMVQNATSKNTEKLICNTHKISNVIDVYNKNMCAIKELYNETKVQAENASTLSNTNKQQIEKLDKVLDDINEDLALKEEHLKNIDTEVDKVQKEVTGINKLFANLKGIFSKNV